MITRRALWYFPPWITIPRVCLRRKWNVTLASRLREWMRLELEETLLDRSPCLVCDDYDAVDVGDTRECTKGQKPIGNVVVVHLFSRRRNCKCTDHSDPGD